MSPPRARPVVPVLLVACLALAGADALLHKHPHFPVESVFAFYAVFGFIGCLALAFGARLLRPLVLQRKEDGDV